MLVLTIVEKEFIQIGDSIKISHWKNGGHFRIGIEAPRDVSITRIPLGSCPYSRALQHTIWMDKELDSSKGVESNG